MSWHSLIPWSKVSSGVAAEKAVLYYFFSHSQGKTMSIVFTTLAYLNSSRSVLWAKANERPVTLSYTVTIAQGGWWGWKQESSVVEGRNSSRTARAVVSASSQGSKNWLVLGDILLCLGLCFSPTKVLINILNFQFDKAKHKSGKLSLVQDCNCVSVETKCSALNQFTTKYSTGNCIPPPAI